METLISEFVQQYHNGAAILQQKIVEEGREDLFRDAMANNDWEQLLELAVHAGIYEIVEFLYIKKQVRFDINLLFRVGVYESIEPQENDELAVSLTTGSSNEKGLNLHFEDKQSQEQGRCVNFLVRMKRYSNCSRQERKFWYRFNKKYTKLAIY